MILLKQEFKNKHFFTSLLAMEKTSTEVSIVDVETAEKEISQDVDEESIQGKAHFKLQLLCYKNMHCVFLLYIDRRRGKTVCMTTPWGVLLNHRLMGMCRWIEWHFHNRVDYGGVSFLTELIAGKGSHIFEILGQENSRKVGTLKQKVRC